jgi:hypothetical protein
MRVCPRRRTRAGRSVSTDAKVSDRSTVAFTLLYPDSARSRKFPLPNGASRILPSA